MKLPKRKSLLMDITRNRDGTVTSRYFIIGAFSGSISKPFGNFLRRMVNRIPQSWYVDSEYRIHSPTYRKNFTDYKNKLRACIDYLDGTNNRVVAVQVRTTEA